MLTCEMRHMLCCDVYTYDFDIESESGISTIEVGFRLVIISIIYNKQNRLRWRHAECLGSLCVRMCVCVCVVWIIDL